VTSLGAFKNPETPKIIPFLSEKGSSAALKEEFLTEPGYGDLILLQYSAFILEYVRQNKMGRDNSNDSSVNEWEQETAFAHGRILPFGRANQTLSPRD
jgi:hypothetical protein